MSVNEGAIAIGISAILCYLGTQFAIALGIPDAGIQQCMPLDNQSFVQLLPSLNVEKVFFEVGERAIYMLLHLTVQVLRRGYPSK